MKLSELQSYQNLVDYLKIKNRQKHYSLVTALVLHIIQLRFIISFLL